jgi:threonine synthase
MSFWKWHKWFEGPEPEHQLSLGEGNTPLIRSSRIGPTNGLPRLWLKLESVNPTGSYKDRFAAAAISHMRARGQNICVATSSGNAGSALAAYCAAASIACKIAVIETATRAKLMQMLAYGAELFLVRGFGVDPQITAATFESLVEFGRRPKADLQISAYRYSPLGMAGVQTIAYEIGRVLPAVRHVFVPAGGGGLTLAVARGFQQLDAKGKIACSPAVHCVQPEGNDTMAGALRSGQRQAKAINCTTAITGLQVPSVIDGDQVVDACRKSGGTGFTVADQQVYVVQQQLAREEGVFCEPAGAVATAAAIVAAQRGEINPEDDVVCLVTGSGFKDLAAAERMAAGVDCPVLSLDELRKEFALAIT